MVTQPWKMVLCVIAYTLVFQSNYLHAASENGPNSQQPTTLTISFGPDGKLITVTGTPSDAHTMGKLIAGLTAGGSAATQPSGNTTASAGAASDNCAAAAAAAVATAATRLGARAPFHRRDKAKAFASHQTAREVVVKLESPSSAPTATSLAAHTTNTSNSNSSHSPAPSVPAPCANPQSHHAGPAQQQEQTMSAHAAPATAALQSSSTSSSSHAFAASNSSSSSSAPASASAAPAQGNLHPDTSPAATQLHHPLSSSGSSSGAHYSAQRQYSRNSGAARRNRGERATFLRLEERINALSAKMSGAQISSSTAASAAAVDLLGNYESTLKGLQSHINDEIEGIKKLQRPVSTFDAPGMINFLGQRNFFENPNSGTFNILNLISANQHILKRLKTQDGELIESITRRRRDTAHTAVINRRTQEKQADYKKKRDTYTAANRAPQFQHLPPQHPSGIASSAAAHAAQYGQTSAHRPPAYPSSSSGSASQAQHQWGGSTYTAATGVPQFQHFAQHLPSSPHSSIAPSAAAHAAQYGQTAAHRPPAYSSSSSSSASHYHYPQPPHLAQYAAIQQPQQGNGNDLSAAERESEASESVCLKGFGMRKKVAVLRLLENDHMFTFNNPAHDENQRKYEINEMESIVTAVKGCPPMLKLKTSAGEPVVLLAQRRLAQILAVRLSLPSHTRRRVATSQNTNASHAVPAAAMAAAAAASAASASAASSSQAPGPHNVPTPKKHGPAPAS